MTSIPMLLNYRNSIIGSSSTSLAVSEEPSSEASSIESNFSDLRTIAAGLGILNPDEIYTERFKIDRMKLEDMIKSTYLINFLTLYISI